MSQGVFASIGFPICSLFFVVFIVLMYVNKKKYKNIENTLFISLLTLSFLSIFSEIIYVYFLSSQTASELSQILACKTFLVFMDTWILTFMTYVLALLTKNKDVNIKNAKRKKIFTAVGLVEILSIVLTIILKVELNTSISGLYSFAGPAVLVSYILGAFALIMSLYAFVFKTQIVEKGQRRIVLLAVIFIIVTLALQFVFPALDYNIQNFQFTLLLLALYFTLENQDNKLLNEHEEQKRQADEANKEQTEFLTSMSHEIRTPMNTIIGFSDALIREGASNEENVKRDVKNIHSAAVTLLDLINNILDLSRVDSQKEQLVEKEFNTVDVVVELDTVIKNKVENRSIDYRLTVDQNLPQILNGDYIKINKIVSNLIGNVISYTKDGEIDLKVQTVGMADNEVNLVFEVTSEGSEIPADEYKKYYSEEETINRINSVVLELNVAKLYSKIVGGTIEVTSKDRYNIGYKFNVKLQIINPKPIGDIGSLLKKEETVEVKDLTGKKILVVDDNTINIKLLERFLKELNIEVESVTSGNDCIYKVKKHDYDLIFLDHMMPVKDGIQTLAELRDIKAKLPPIIALTANSYSGIRDYYLNAGFKDYLAKPVNRNDLTNVLYKYIK